MVVSISLANLTSNILISMLVLTTYKIMTHYEPVGTFILICKQLLKVLVYKEFFIEWF